MNAFFLIFAIVYLKFIPGCLNAGTLSVQDVLTDLGAEEVDLFLGGKADGKYGRAVPLPLCQSRLLLNFVESA